MLNIGSIIMDVIFLPETNISYHTKIARQRTERLRNLTRSLPACCEDFFRGIEPTTTVLTRLNYAYDLRTFFHYLSEHEPDYLHLTMNEFDNQVLSTIRPIVLERYLEYLNFYKKDDGRELENSNAGKKRKTIFLEDWIY